MNQVNHISIQVDSAREEGWISADKVEKILQSGEELINFRYKKEK